MRLALAALSLIVVAACSADDSATSSDDVTSVPESGVRDQKDTGNCWLFATTGWAESLEIAADPSAAAKGHWAVTYLDYWDWLAKITKNGIRAKTDQGVKDELDSGGSWGAASELILAHGLVRQSEFTTEASEANLIVSAQAVMADSLLHGALKTTASRKDETLVRSELDRAFGVTHAFTPTMPSAIEVRLPKRDGTHVIATLADAIGTAKSADDPDTRVGPLAWSHLAFHKNLSLAKRRDFFRRVQRALHGGVPVPIGWYWADTANVEGVFRAPPDKPADPIESAYHEALIDDYEANDVPGFGTLHAGDVASPQAQAAALAEKTQIVFLRIKDSFGALKRPDGAPPGYDDVYMDYLLGTVHTCPKGVAPTSARCSDNDVLDDVVLPAGF